MKHTIVVDWDGTCVRGAWPEQTTEWMPGAVKALKTISSFAHIVVFSSRTSPYDPFTRIERDPAEVASEVNYIRNTLDDAGLYQVDIWTLAGKPGGTVYIDDRAERYHGRVGSWKAMVEKVAGRCFHQAPEFPPFRERGN